MKRPLVFAGAIAIAVLGLSPVASAGRDVQRLVERCLTAIDQVTLETNGRVDRICARTLDVIETRLARGDVRGAYAAGREGAARAERIAMNGEQTIGEGVRRCIRILQRNGGDRESINAIRTAAERASRRIRGNLEGCLAAILDALGEDREPPKGDPPPRDPPPRDPPPRR